MNKYTCAEYAFDVSNFYPLRVQLYLTSSQRRKNTLRAGKCVISFTPPECQIVCIIKEFGVIPYAFASVFIEKLDPAVQERAYCLVKRLIAFRLVY